MLNWVIRTPSEPTSYRKVHLRHSCQSHCPNEKRTGERGKRNSSQRAVSQWLKGTVLNSVAWSCVLLIQTYYICLYLKLIEHLQCALLH